jgi:hypothetical protein
MIEVTLEAIFRPSLLTFEQGAKSSLGLLRKLSDLPGFSSGWETGGARLNADESAFIHALEKLQAGEGADAGFHFAVAENASGLSKPLLPPESYLFEIAFDSVLGNLKVKISMIKSVATFEMILGIVTHLCNWSDLQHVSVVPAFYVPDDSPIDHISRHGIGWAGWVPFPLTHEQLPEAGYLETLGQGMFIASQDTYWEVTDRAAVKRARDLELKLNALGKLPTRTILQKGTWGQSQ